MDLTILVVTRDRPALLDHALRSILVSAAAAEPDVTTRVLVIDDSPDGNAERVAAVLDVDYERNPSRGAGVGLCTARAWAISRIKTDMIAMFDDDDEMLPDHIRLLARGIVGGADVCSTWYWYADPDPADSVKLIPRRLQPFREARLGDLLAGYQVINDGAMMRTSVAQSVVWDCTRDIYHVYHVWLQMLFDDRTFVVNRSGTFLYRQHPGTLTRRIGPHEDEIRARLLAEYRALAVERFGRVPRPSLPVRLTIGRRALGRAVRGR